MTEEVKREIIDRVKQNVVLEIDQEYAEFFAKQSNLLRRAYRALDSLESTLSHYHHNFEQFFN